VDQLASVHVLGDRYTVEDVAAEIADDIRYGRLLPGQELQLPEIADQRGVRLRSLQLLCAGLERNGLLTLYGNVAIVAPLDLHELRAIYRHLHALEADMITRASDRAAPAELERLHTMLPNDTMDREAASTVVVDFFTALCMPAATAVDLHIYTDARHNLRRYLRLGFQILQGSNSSAGASRASEDADRDAMCHTILDLYRRAKHSDIRIAVTEFRRRGQQVAELSFEGEHPSRPTLRSC
jgi:DNA-binding GntR family transcriptional regulator